MSTENLKFISITRLNDKKPVIEYVASKKNKAFLEEFKQLALTMVIEHTTTNKFDTGSKNYIYGMCHILIDKGKFAFICLTQSSFNYNVAFKALNELKLQFYRTFPILESNPESEVNYSNNHEFLITICDKYNQEGIEKTMGAQLVLDKAAESMKGNINKMVMNTNQLSDLEIQSNQFRSKALEFEMNSNTLATKMQKRKYKMYLIIVCCIIVAFLIYYYLC